MFLDVYESHMEAQSSIRAGGSSSTMKTTHERAQHNLKEVHNINLMQR